MIEVTIQGKETDAYVQAKCNSDSTEVEVQNFSDKDCKTKSGAVTKTDIKGKSKDDCVKTPAGSAKVDCSAGSTATISMAVVAVAAFFMSM